MRAMNMGKGREEEVVESRCPVNTQLVVKLFGVLSTGQEDVQREKA